jgi:hypothetical protein
MGTPATCAANWIASTCRCCLLLLLLFVTREKAQIWLKKAGNAKFLVHPATTWGIRHWLVTNAYQPVTVNLFDFFLTSFGAVERPPKNGRYCFRAAAAGGISLGGCDV